MNNSNVSLASDSSALVSKDELKVRIEKVRREEKKNRKEIVKEIHVQHAVTVYKLITC